MVFLLFVKTKKTETPRPRGTMDVPVGLLEPNRLPGTMLDAGLPFGKASGLFTSPHYAAA
jgi:hypothetical protein